MINKACFISALLGACTVLAFAPFDIYPVAFLSIAGLVYLAGNTTPTNAFKIGLSFGLGLYLFGVSWVYVSLSVYGGMPLWMGSIAVLGFSLLLALFSAMATGLSSYLALSSRISFVLVFPFVWVIFEWCKSWVLTGFPWLDIAYTQTLTWIAAWAPVGGVYLVSFMLVVIAILLLRFCLASSLKDRLIPVVGLVLLVGTSLGLNHIRWTSTDGKPITIGIVQANVPIETKWQSEVQRLTLQNYRQFGHQLANDKTLDLLVLPETAMPLYVSQTDPEFWKTMRPEGAALLSGILDHDGENGYNAAALSCSDSIGPPQVYRKRHLVPFGEYQPLKFLFAWVFEYLQLPMSDFASGPGTQELSCGAAIKVGLSICYEDSFSNEYRNHLGDASVLVNISEDAWFGDSLAPHQRKQFAQFRAKEMGRPLVRAANSGPSLFIDSQGRVEAVTAQFEVAAMSRSVQPMKGETPFMKFGSWIVWLSLIFVLASLFVRLRVSA